ncbi:MAG TPA: hypothetical protein VGR69_03120 [Candidatus Rubrimentiphilum sp.]|nr:hypothetical protein [Candidatus Rubrimentiphilum sp.]
MAALEEMVLLPEVQARRQLAGRVTAFSVLSPVGAYAGVGILRVLRLAQHEGIEVIVGYDSYERLS